MTEQDHAAVLAELPEGTRHYVLNAEPGHYTVNPATADGIGVTAQADGNTEQRSGGQLKPTTVQATGLVSWPTKRFTYETDEGIAVLELPSRLSRQSAGELFGWFANLVRQAQKRGGLDQSGGVEAAAPKEEHE